jgi:hypothetical protein
MPPSAVGNCPPPMTRACLVRAALALGLLLAACDSGKAPTQAAGMQAQAWQEASARSGDIVVRANAMPTSMLGEAVAKQYGIERDAASVMLLVGVRRGSDASETAVPARVTARATNLLGKRQAIAMREVRSGEFVDHVGIARVVAPDTLGFDLDVVPEGAPAMQLHFNRDFFPE